MEDRTVTGKIYYPSGALYFDGTYDPSEFNNLRPWKPLRLIEGTVYYENGKPKTEGTFQKAGLLKGRKYYPSGKLWFEGECNDKFGINGQYYGPAFPVSGKFYDEDGNVIWEGKTEMTSGGVGYPMVIKPEGFKLDWD